jgi:hypothetical protein
LAATNHRDALFCNGKFIPGAQPFRGEISPKDISPSQIVLLRAVFGFGRVIMQV